MQIIKRLVLLVVALVVITADVRVSAQQATATQYFYDNNGRLVRVVLASGVNVIYEYDLAGNITAIRRTNLIEVSITSFSPTQGIAADRVTIEGIGFEPVAANNYVKFNGVIAQVESVNSTQTQLIAVVPQGATTGNIQITTTTGTAQSNQVFTVLQITINPSSVNMFPGQRVQFNASSPATISDTTIIWSVNAILGGNTTVGVISSTGLYTAPNVSNSTFIIKATSITRSDLFGQAQAVVKASFYDAQAQGVSVQRGMQTGIGFSAVSVQRGTQTGIGFSAISVQRGQLSKSLPLESLSSAVSLTTGPVITSITPTSIRVNTTTQITINGVNLSGASKLSFITSAGNIDSSISVSNIVVNTEGSLLTANLTTASSTATAVRVVVVSVAAVQSSTVNLGVNTLQIIP